MAADLGISHRDVYYYAGDAAREQASVRRDQSEMKRSIELAAARSVAVASLDTETSSARGLVRRTRDAVAASHPQLSYADLGNVVQQAIASVRVSIGSA